MKLDVSQNKWKELYKDTLVGVTTTSLYGSFSQYSGLKYWKGCGETSGTAVYDMTHKLRAEVRKYLAWHHPFQYYEYMRLRRDFGLVKRSLMTRANSNLYRLFGFDLKQTQNNFKRGIFFSCLYTNTREFLKGEIEEKDLIKKFDNSVDSLTDLWKNKYAKKRIKSLQKQNKVSTDLLFYDDMLHLTWKETKEKYLKEN